MTTATEVARRARDLGVSLRAEGGAIVARTSGGPVPGELRDALRAHKADVVALLAGAYARGHPAPCRATVRLMPVAYREMWGRLAAEIEDRGVPWPRSEWEALDRTAAELRAAEDRGELSESDYP